MSSGPIQCLSAITLTTPDMARAVAFFCDLGFELLKGDGEAAFATFGAGSQRLNLTTEGGERGARWWGRAIFYVDDVDTHYRRLTERGIRSAAPPRDAPWGERYFHVTTPDGHELSFAKPL